MKDDKTTSILLDIQKQLGSLGVAIANVHAETKVQSESLKNMTEKIETIDGTVKKHDSIITNWQGRIAVIGAIVGIVGTTVAGWLKSKIL